MLGLWRQLRVEYKYLLNNCQDLSSCLQYPLKKLCVTLRACHPSGVGDGRMAGTFWPARLVKKSLVKVQLETLPQGHKAKNDRTRYVISSCSLHICTHTREHTRHICTGKCTRIHTHTHNFIFILTFITLDCYNYSQS